MLCQIVRTGGFDAPLGVAQSFPWNLPFLHREGAVLIEDLIPDPCEIFPQMQIRLLIEEVDRLVVLYYSPSGGHYHPEAACPPFGHPNACPDA